MTEKITKDKIIDKRNSIIQWVTDQRMHIDTIYSVLDNADYEYQVKEAFESLKDLSAQAKEEFLKWNKQIKEEKSSFIAMVKQFVIQISEANEEDLKNKYEEINEVYFAELEEQNIRFESLQERLVQLKNLSDERESFTKIKIEEVRGRLNMSNTTEIQEEIATISQELEDFKNNDIKPQIDQIREEMMEIEFRFEESEKALIERTYEIGRENAVLLGRNN